jgi:hypothetical protein
MIRSAFLLCVGIGVATCFACAPLPPAPPPPFTPPPACAAISNIGVVPAWDPTTARGAPTVIGLAPANIQADLLTAYNAAPAFFQTQLCNLNGIFVTQGPQSWGYRDINTGARYIAISMSLWGTSGPITLDQYQNKVFDSLNWNTSVDQTPPTYLPASPNNGTTTIIAALAHEFGHVLWYDILVVRDGTGTPFTGKFCNKILTDYLENGVRVPYWSNLPPVVWRGFEDLDPNPPDIPDDPNDRPGSDPDKTEAKAEKMVKALRHGNTYGAHRRLWRILAFGRPFPSLLGAFSANEHFVEAFTLYTLRHAPTPLTSLRLQVSPGFVRDIPQDLSLPLSPPNPQSRKRLRKVLECFDTVTSHP